MRVTQLRACCFLGSLFLEQRNQIRPVRRTANKSAWLTARFLLVAALGFPRSQYDAWETAGNGISGVLGGVAALFSFLTRSAATNTAPFQPLILLRWNNHLISFLLTLSPLRVPVSVSIGLSLISILCCIEIQSAFSFSGCSCGENEWINKGSKSYCIGNGAAPLCHLLKILYDSENPEFKF